MTTRPRPQRPPPRPRSSPLVFGVFVVMAVVAAATVAGLALDRRTTDGAGRSLSPGASDEPTVPLIEDAALAALFATPPAAPLTTSVGPATVTVRDGPAIQLPDGRLVAGDVFFLPDQGAFEGRLPAGEAPVSLLLAAFADDQRIAAVLIGDRSGVAGLRWAPAAVTGQPPPGPGETIAFGVDSGTAGFTSAEAAARIGADAGYGDRALEALEDAEFTDAVRFPIDDTRTLDVLAVSSGWGDGSYVTWVGTDATGTVVAYLTSFDVLDQPAATP